MMASLPPPPPGLLDGAALFLDFDGTLVELAETPGAIRVPPELGSLLGRLKVRLEGRLAIVSGRSIADLDRHLGLSAMACSGSHGAEIRLADGKALPLSLPPGLADAGTEIIAFADAVPGLLVEEKPAGFALHYRLAPDQAEPVQAFMSDLARRYGLMIQRGNAVAEVKPPGASKGKAIRAFMTEPEFADARPVFMGDDLTDEDGFDAAASLGGAGILVGPMRPTQARYRLQDVSEVLEWLNRIS